MRLWRSVSTTMVRNRWLVVIKAEPEQSEAGLVYGLWVYALDEQMPHQARRCATVDELFEVLFAFQPPAPPMAE